jgi:CxxC motif-containing protein
MRELICITCPRGCHLQVDEEHGCAVTGNACPRGEAYGKAELLHPVRVVTSTVRIQGAAIPRLPVKTDRPLPKEKMFACMDLINTITARAPVEAGDVLAAHILGTDVNLIATKSL